MMANGSFLIFAKQFPARTQISAQQIRHGHVIRGKPPTIARTLKQRLDEMQREQIDPTTSFKVNIGFSVPKPSKAERAKSIAAFLDERKTLRSNPDVERQARHKSFTIDSEKVKDYWSKMISPFDTRKIAEHYGIFQHLFGDAYFLPIVPLEIDYKLEGKEEGVDMFVRVHRGNVIKPSEASVCPNVQYTAADSNSLWTLIMSTPDGNMQNSNNEYCHWFLGNIPENKTEAGEQVMDYLRPIPPRGVGYYRYVFVLYKQKKRLDYAQYKKAKPCLQLQERDWNTLEFYRKHQDDLTPAGLAFFQSDWDTSTKEFYHSSLGTREPIFQYDFPKPYIKPQKWFPLKEPFNLYLDKYRDPKEINKEFLLKKLKDEHPFNGPKPPPKYPNAVTEPKYIPSWLRLEMMKERLGWGRVNETN